jgi:hypothetical protein
VTQLAHPSVLRAVGTIWSEYLIERSMKGLLQVAPVPIHRVAKVRVGLDAVHELAHGRCCFRGCFAAVGGPRFKIVTGGSSPLVRRSGSSKRAADRHERCDDELKDGGEPRAKSGYAVKDCLEPRDMILELLRDQPGQPNLLTATLEVTDEHGELVLELPFSEALISPPDEPPTQH